MGAARYTYQLQVTDLPEGYRVIKPYGGATNAPKVDDGSSEETRNSDSNFSQTATPTTEKFYLQSSTDDMTYDLGLMRMRDLTIRKVGTDGKLVEGATFAIYGHFYTITLIASWAGRPSPRSPPERMAAIPLHRRLTITSTLTPTTSSSRPPRPSITMLQDHGRGR